LSYELGWPVRSIKSGCRDLPARSNDVYSSG
jgi:hypothetical protein